MLPTIATGNVASALAGEYEVANSLRFDDGSSDYINRTPSGAGNRKTWTFSIWFKRGVITSGAQHKIFSVAGGGSNNFECYFNTNDTLAFYHYSSNGGVTDSFLGTNQVFRDVSAWYHLVLSVDTTQGTASNRVKMYVNGEQVSSFSSSSYFNQDHDTYINSTAEHRIGGNLNGSQYFDGYMAEIVLVDGQQLDPTSFGEFDSDTNIWKPKDVSGLTFGTNGFYLDFENSGSLGADVSGNGNNFTVNNLTSIDQTTDTCTNNFATMNALDNYYAGSTFSEGNLKVVTTGSNITYNTSTIGFSSGKWYMETKLSGSSGYTVGIIRGVSEGNNNDNKLGNRSDGWSYDDGGIVENSGGTVSGTSGYSTYASGDIIGVYADLDNNKLYFSKNGSLQSSTGIDITAGTYFFAVGDNNASNSSTFEVNFGNPTFSITSGNTDGEYGNFEYSTTITGDSASKTFKALNTKNLAEYG